MLSKILGIILILLGGLGILGVVFPIIGSILGLAFLLLKLLIPLLMLYVGVRLLRREDSEW